MNSPTASGSRLARLCAVFAIVAALGFALADALLTNRYLARVSAERFQPDPLTLPLQEIPVSVAPDGQTWIRHALALAEPDAPASGWRLRHTAIDNAPHGREVHWNSAWAWWLAGLGELRAKLTGETFAQATERAARWAQLPLFIVTLGLACWWTARRWGSWAATALALGCVGNRAFYEGFSPGYPDHHGLIHALLLGLVLGALGMGAGWVRTSAVSGSRDALPSSEKEAENAAMLSAICGGLGLWVSAVSTLVPVALIGIGGALVSCLGTASLRGSGAKAHARTWRLWGGAGALTSLACYLFEYAPSGFGWRLEVNHPLYALAWWCGADLVARIVEWRGDSAVGTRDRRAVARALPALLALAAAVAVFLLRGHESFIPEQPFMKRLYTHVDELKPFSLRLSEQGLRPNRDLLGWQLFLAVGLAVTWFGARRLRAATFVPLLVVTLLAVAMTALGWKQNRWLLTAGSAQVVALAMLAWAWSDARGKAVRAACIAGGVFALGVCAMGPWMLLSNRLKVESRRDVQRGEAMELLYRDLAQCIRRDQPEGRVVLLASPNASTAIGYYGRFETLGTFYWENHAGLESAARLLLARDDDEARRRMRDHGVTHIVMLNAHQFLEEYHHALRPAWPVEESFGWRLTQGQAPAWLRPLPYSIPPQFSRWTLRARVYAVEANSSASAKEFAALRAAANAGDPGAAGRLAWRLATARDATERNGPEALRLARILVEAHPESAVAHAVLAAAHAENGAFPEANGAVLQAQMLAHEQSLHAFAAQLEVHGRAYQAGRAWRE